MPDFRELIGIPPTPTLEHEQAGPRALLQWAHDVSVEVDPSSLSVWSYRPLLELGRGKVDDIHVIIGGCSTGPTLLEGIHGFWTVW